MSKNIEFYFDFGSPTAYLAYKQLNKLAQKYDATIEYKGILLGGVFKATDNASPITIPAKGQYMVIHDLPRFTKRYDIELKFNPHFPINTLPLMRGYYAALELGVAEAYVEKIYDGMWIEEINFSDPTELETAIKSLGVDVARFNDLISSDAIKNQLKATTEEAVTRGAFGAPTMYIGDEMFFGQDRLDFVEERLAE